MENFPLNRKDFGSRLKIIRSRLGLSGQQIADTIEVPRSAVTRLEYGQQGMTADQLFAFIGFTNANPEYLLIGNGPMFREEGNKGAKANQEESADLARMVEVQGELIVSLRENAALRAELTDLKKKMIG